MMINRLKILLTGTLRRQLIFGMVFAVAGMMSLFVWDMTQRQQAVVQEQQSGLAVALAQSVSTSAAVWVASRDYSGLQEIVDGLDHYPDLQHAIVLDTKGQVLAHGDVARRGLYLSDLPPRPLLEFLGHDATLVDVANPIMLAGNHIGWVRIGLGRQSMAAKMAEISRNGIVYVLIAIALAAVMSTLAARRLTRRLYAIQSVADAVQAGSHELRVDLSGVDEAASLARQFNGMLDTLKKREAEIVTSRDALAQSESRLNQVMAVTGEGIWDWDLGSNRVRHNPSWYAMLGLDASYHEHPQDVFATLLHEDDRATVAARIQDCLDGKGKYHSEHRMRHADGRMIWVQDRGDVVERDAADRPLRMLGSMTDISERKKMEETLRQAYGENRAVTQAVRDALYMLNESGRLVWWNRQLQEVTGLAPVTLNGMACVEFFVAEDRAAVAQALGKVFAEGYGEVVARINTKSGPVYHHFNGVRVQDAQGKTIGIAGVGRDISERLEALEALQQSERELKALNESLEARVSARTTELSSARDEAERANRAKSDFLSSMSHELRTPMNAILGFAQIMDYDTNLPDEYRHSVNEILSAGFHLLDLINGVLDLSQIESGHINLSLESVEVCAVVDDCLKLINPIAEKHDIHLSHAGLEGAMVHADRTRLKQALLNLLSNAIKYNREGGTVRIGVKQQDAERLRIVVTDTGVGINAAQLAELFQPFNRLHAANSSILGTGIGLTITRRIIEAMGGSVDVESEVGRGSAFWIELPLEFLPAQTRPHPPLESFTTPTQQSAAANCTVLYIEDNPSNLRLVAQLLGQRRHIRLLSAHTAELGIELAMAHHPDLILLDINMPNLDGYQVMEILRLDAQLHDTPVIAVTANAMPRDIERGMAAGFNEYLTKPLDVPHFYDVIDRILKDAPTGTQ